MNIQITNLNINSKEYIAEAEKNDRVIDSVPFFTDWKLDKPNDAMVRGDVVSWFDWQKGKHFKGEVMAICRFPIATRAVIHLDDGGWSTVIVGDIKTVNESFNIYWR